MAFEPSTQGKKLIQYGWDSPDTAYLRKNLKRMERSPFDGIMLTVRQQAGGDGVNPALPGEAGGHRAV